MTDQPIKTFVAKPVEVTGILWTGDNFDQIRRFTNGMASLEKTNGATILYIETTEGSSRARIGDTILMGTMGEFYPCKPRVLAAKYDEVHPNE
ncbi:hypothetical protein [Streptomyces sp. NPDC048720]|uniref:hypothetical protein n=1 Tax=Streptomyces sp. NPDC048720 TaxID=3365588 RepID=UPI003720F81D